MYEAQNVFIEIRVSLKPLMGDIQTKQHLPLLDLLKTQDKHFKNPFYLK